MTVLIKSTRIEAARRVADDRRQRGRVANYSINMIDAEELVRALEVLGIISFTDDEKIGPPPRSER